MGLFEYSSLSVMTIWLYFVILMKSEEPSVRDKIDVLQILAENK